MVYTAGSLFSGIGGIDYAFASAGFDIRFQVEIDPFCRKVLKKHAWSYWRNAVIHEDVRHVGKRNVESVDVLFGGFPCQDISISGKRAGIQQGTRSGLWFEFARLIGELRPRAVLLENVKDIISLGGTAVIGGLAEMGYVALWMPLRAADFGAPHQRERWFCIAVPDPYGFGLPQSTANQPGSYQHGVNTSAQQPGHNELHANFRSGETVGDGVASTRLGSQTPQSADRGRKRDGNQSRMGISANGLPRRLVEHRFPAYMGQEQCDFEPPRTIASTRETNYWEEKVHALGNAVVPQVIYPLALAINAWLTQIDTAQAANTEVAA